MATLQSSLPDYLNLGPHLSAHKYMLVCSLTVMTWDFMVLSPRSWTLLKSEGWPVMKILFHFLRIFVPLEFIVVGVAFFDTNFPLESCSKFYLFEPICTAIVLAAASAVHVIRIHAIYDRSRTVLFGLGVLFAIQVVVEAISSGFYQVVPLLAGQGCIAGPKFNWVGIYWVAPTILYTSSFALAVRRSVDSLKVKPLSPWKLILRDGLNLYGAISMLNVINVLFWLIMQPSDNADTIKTILTSLTVILTASMTMRIVLSVRGSLINGGAFALSSSQVNRTSRNTHVISNTHSQPTYTIDERKMAASKAVGPWNEEDKSSVQDAKSPSLEETASQPDSGVKITIDREVVYDAPLGTQ